MPRRSQRSDPDAIRVRLIALLNQYKPVLEGDNLRSRVQGLIPVVHGIRDLGASLIKSKTAKAARKRILAYFVANPQMVIKGDELMIVSGINEWPRRIRELRGEHGWQILSGETAKEMADEGDELPQNIDINGMRDDDYILLSTDQDVMAVQRWKTANRIRRKSGSVRDKILEFLRENVGTPVSGEDLRYVAGNKTEWARRTRELRTEFGWPIATKSTGRPDLPVGRYVLELDRQSKPHDRKIPDPERRRALQRDGYSCVNCGWNYGVWNKADPRILELHHKKHHARGGSNLADNLMTLCNVCHDDLHRKEKLLD